MKVTSKLVGNTPTQEIDWDKPQLLVNDTTGVIVLSNGEHKENSFSGIVLVKAASYRDVGFYNQIWAKHNFQPINPNQQVILQNTDEPSPTSE